MDIGGPGCSDPEVFAAIVAQSPDAIILADRAGLVRVWNASAARLFGHAAQEVLGQAMDLIIPEPLRAAHWKGFRSAVDSGRTRYAGRTMTTRSVHKDGRRLYIDLAFGLLEGEPGVVLGVIASARDCTERYLADKQVQARLRDLETRLAQ